MPYKRPVKFNTSDDKNFYTSDSERFKVLEEFDGLGITFYYNSGEDNVVDKTSFLTEVREVYGVLKDETNIIKPVIDFTFDFIPDFNYAYIEEFDRYYFITDITSIGLHMWEISFEEDVLMTYKNGIYELNGFIDRNEEEYDEAIEDTKRVAEIGYDIEEYHCHNFIFESGLEFEHEANPSVVINGFGLNIGKGAST